MASERIPERKDIPAEYTWDLTDIFESDEAWLSEYEALKTEGEKISAFAGKLGRRGLVCTFVEFKDGSCIDKYNIMY